MSFNAFNDFFKLCRSASRICTPRDGKIDEGSPVGGKRKKGFHLLHLFDVLPKRLHFGWKARRRRRRREIGARRGDERVYGRFRVEIHWRACVSPPLASALTSKQDARDATTFVDPVWKLRGLFPTSGVGCVPNMGKQVFVEPGSGRRVLRTVQKDHTHAIQCARTQV